MPPGLGDTERAVASTIATWLYPPAGALGVSGAADRVSVYVDDYAARLPTASRLQFRALLHAMDRGFGPWAGRPTARLTEARPKDVAAYLTAWAKAPTYTQRMLFEGLRTVLMMAYASDPEVRARCGIPWLGDT